MSDFDDIINGLSFEEPTDIVDVSTLGTVDLLGLIDRLEAELLDAGELLHPHTQESRDKHSLRNAAGVEYEKRKHENCQ